MRVVIVGGGAESGGDGSVYTALGFELHIEPKNPRADWTISAARFTSVPACSCTPSSDTRCARVGCLDVGDLTGESGLVGLAGSLGSEDVATAGFVGVRGIGGVEGGS